MKTISIIILIICFGQMYSQDKLVIDEYARSIDSLYLSNRLIKKEYPGRTFAGSLSGYYNYDTLVYINTLTDGESGGIETKYYVKDTVIYKVLRMTASFKSPEEWSKYYKHHTANLSCDNCHNKKHCDKTTIYLIPPFSVVSVIKGKQQSLKPEEKLLELFNTSQTFKSLRTLLSKT